MYNDWHQDRLVGAVDIHRLIDAATASDNSLSASRKGMSKEKSIKDYLAKLRRQLAEEVVPPETEKVVEESATDPVDKEALEETFSLAVDDALKGIDIQQRYPTFYRRLLADPSRRQDFLDALEILEQSQTGELAPLPEAERADLSFLDDEAQRPPSGSLTGSRWRLAWREAAEKVDSLLVEFLQIRPGYRAGANQEEQLTLIDDADTLSGRAITVLLTATSRMVEPNQLSLRLLVTGTRGDVKATVQWGKYRASGLLDARGLFTFPLLPLIAILDEAGSTVDSDLILVLEPALPGEGNG